MGEPSITIFGSSLSLSICKEESNQFLELLKFLRELDVLLLNVMFRQSVGKKLQMRQALDKRDGSFNNHLEQSTTWWFRRVWNIFCYSFWIQYKVSNKAEKLSKAHCCLCHCQQIEWQIHWVDKRKLNFIQKCSLCDSQNMWLFHSEWNTELPREPIANFLFKTQVRNLSSVC